MIAAVMKRFILMIVLAMASAAQADVGPATRPATVPATRPMPLGHPPKPTSHTVKQIEGWSVQVDDRLLSEPDKRLGDRALLLLGHQLSNVAMHLPPDKVERLRAVKIQIDLSHGLLTTAQYHPSRGWLRMNGFKETLEKAVHIPHAGRFASPRLQRDQPWMVLHELAHAYHDQVLGFREPRIKAAWQRFVESGKYKSVRHVNGSTTTHYALTNEKEFFAEMSESFFGINDFFPFNPEELKAAEPELFGLLDEIWRCAE
jgi:hypothetical protein